MRSLLGGVWLVFACASAGPPPAPEPPLATVSDDGNSRISSVALVCSTRNPDALVAYDTAASIPLAEGASKADAERAILNYERAIAADPGFCDAMDNLGVIYRRMGRLEEAIELYQRSVKVAPTNRTGWMNLGVALRMADRLAEAADAYQELVALDGRDPEGWFGLGQILALQDRGDDALVALSRAEALYREQRSPYLSDARVLMARLYVRKSDWLKVRELLEPIYRALTESAEVNLWLAVACVAGEPRALDRARIYAERARELGAVVSDALWTAAHATEADLPPPPR